MEAHKRIDDDYNNLCNRIMSDDRHDLSENDRYFVPPFVLGAEWMQKQQWVRVEERRPKVGELILYHIGVLTNDGIPYDIAKYHGGLLMVMDYWMPCPILKTT